MHIIDWKFRKKWPAPQQQMHQVFFCDQLRGHTCSALLYPLLALLISVRIDDFIIRNWSILHSRCRKSLLLHYCFFNATCFIGQPRLFGDGWSQARWKAHIEFLRLWGAKSALMPGRSPHSYDVELRTLLKLVQQVMLQSVQEHRLLRHLSVRCFVIPFIFWIIWKRLLLRNNCISICLPSIESSDALVIQMVEEYWLLPPAF